MIPTMNIVDEAGNSVKDINFGIVPYGEPKQVRLFINNPSVVDFFDVRVVSNNPSVKVVQSSFQIPAMNSKELVLYWDAVSSLKDSDVKLSVMGKFVE